MPGWTFVGVKPSEKGQAREKGRVDRRKGGRNAGKEGAKEGWESVCTGNLRWINKNPP